MRARALVVSFLLLLSPQLLGQNAMDHVERGHRLADENRHMEAIDQYLRAITIDPSLETQLNARIGRQYLWADESEKAVDYLAKFLQTHGDCDVRMDYALALSWSNRIRPALVEYDSIEKECSSEIDRSTIRLRQALLYRWLDRPTRADALYQEVLDSGTSDQQLQAREGQAHVALMLDHNAAALEQFSQLLDEGFVNQSVLEGHAVSVYRLGDRREAIRELEEARGQEVWGRSVERLHRKLTSMEDPTITPLISGFHDADGTEKSSLGLELSKVWGELSLAIDVETSTLELDDLEIDDQALGFSFSGRLSPTVTASGALATHDFDNRFDPLTGELNLTIVPLERARVDVTLARIIVSDNIAALTNELEGDFFGAGFDWRFRTHDTFVVSGDVTEWSDDNRRTRLRVNFRHRFEGVPRVTLSWPTLFQAYDEPFSFALFSPEEYYETGPAVNIYRRLQSDWEAYAYGRLGIQQEDSRSSELLGQVRLTLQRELVDRCGARIEAGWSNSSLAGTGGFERTSGSISISCRL